MTTAAILVAGGRGLRAGFGEIPKQYRPLAGKAVLLRTLDAFLAHQAVDAVLVVIADEDASRYRDIAPQSKKLLPPVAGGRTRQESVRRGLDVLATTAPDRVLIHDGVRPFVSPALIARVIAALKDAEAVVPLLPVASTLKALKPDGTVGAAVSRDGLFAAETPQGFRYQTIRDAHLRAAEAGKDFTDDAGLAEWAGVPVRSVAGEADNVKLTTTGDIEAAERRLVAETALADGDVRVGVGYDVHALGPGFEVVLGGVHIPHTRGLVGHSDADIVLHALTDAVLGALADGDIGVHFPSSDDQWKDASSDRFLAFAAARVAARGGRIAHLDVAIVAEGPKIGPHRDAMRARIAAICGIRSDQVGVKATTNEGLGFIGRGEGVSATATATIRLPYGTLR